MNLRLGLYSLFSGQDLVRIRFPLLLLLIAAYICRRLWLKIQRVEPSFL